VDYSVSTIGRRAKSYPSKGIIGLGSEKKNVVVARISEKSRRGENAQNLRGGGGMRLKAL